MTPIIFFFVIHWIVTYGIPIGQINYTIVAIPDTQYYSAYWPDIFIHQTQWICQCKAKLDIIYASHLGDLVEHKNSLINEWSFASYSIDNLLKCNMPHGIVAGNHDVEYEESGEYEQYRMFNYSFPISKYRDQKWFGGSHSRGDMRNTFSLVSAPDGTNYIMINIEYLPVLSNQQNITSWIISLLTTFSNRTAIISSHYVADDCSDEVFYVFSDIAKRFCNVLLLLGGHTFDCGGEMTVKIPNNCGGSAFSLVSDYQGIYRGGSGWLRYYNFRKSNSTNKICVFTFSPYYNEFKLQNKSYFSIDLLSNTIQPGCSLDPCFSRYIPHEFLLGNITVVLSNILVFFYLIMDSD
jgi:hypothetical protein